MIAVFPVLSAVLPVCPVCPVLRTSPIFLKKILISEKRPVCVDSKRLEASMRD